MPTRMAKPDFRPMPVHKVIYHPAMMAAIGPVYRAVTLIAITYWLAGCRELPNDATAFSAIARTPNAHLTPIKPAILSAWSEIAPILKTDWEAQVAHEKHRHDRAQIGGKAAAANARLKRQAIIETSPPPPHAARTEPLSTELRRQIAKAATFQTTSGNARLSDGSGSAGKSPEPAPSPAQAA